MSYAILSSASELRINFDQNILVEANPSTAGISPGDPKRLEMGRGGKVGTAYTNNIGQELVNNITGEIESVFSEMHTPIFSNIQRMVQVVLRDAFSTLAEPNDTELDQVRAPGKSLSRTRNARPGKPCAAPRSQPRPSYQRASLPPVPSRHHIWARL